MSAALRKPAPLTLAERISAALQDASADAATFPPLLQEVAAAVTANVAATEIARKAALDPHATATATKAARQRVDNLTFDGERLAVATAHIEQAAFAAAQRESSVAKAAAYDAAQAERDALVDELKARFPALVAEMITLLDRVKASDAAVAKVNGTVPGREWLARAETIARGLNSSMRRPGDAYGTMITNLVDAVQLPHFGGREAARGCAWHPKHGGPC